MPHTANQVQKGGLARAGLPHDGDHFTRRNGEANMIHGVDILVALPEHLGQILYCNCIHRKISSLLSYSGRSTRLSKRCSIWFIKGDRAATLLRKADALCMWPVGFAVSIAPTGRCFYVSSFLFICPYSLFAVSCFTSQRISIFII